MPETRPVAPLPVSSRRMSWSGRGAWLFAGSLALSLSVAHALPPGVARAEPSAAGFTLAAELRHGAYRVPGAPNVIVHAPPGFDRSAPLQLVVFLHGYHGCVAVLMGEGPTRCKAQTPECEGWALGRYHDAARTNTLFIVPQLAFLQKSSRPGAFGKRGGFRAFLEELLGDTLAKQLGGARRVRDLASVTLVAHSAGYQTALAIAERGGVRPLLRAIVLLDALYGETDRYARVIESQADKGLRFVSVYLARGRPRQESERLYRRLRRSLGRAVEQAGASDELERSVATHAVVFAAGRPPHRLMPQHHLTELLRGLQQPVPGTQRDAAGARP